MGPPGMHLTVLQDFPEEGWPSMDLAAGMLVRELERRPRDEVRVRVVRPAFVERVGRLPGLGRSASARRADLLLNRFWTYPRALKRLSDEGGSTHVCDHSYGHLLHHLPVGRSGVFCHDLDTFRCLLEPARDPRPRWFRAMARRVLSGVERAAVVFFSTNAVRAEIDRFGLFSPERLVQVGYGVSPEFAPDAPPAAPDEAILAALGVPAGARYVLHVGSCIPRKRIDVLLRVFRGLRARRPDLLLVKVGTSWAADQLDLIRSADLTRAILPVDGISRAQLGALYRGAALVLQPSEREGFGLPVLEALACAAPVVASDIAPLREVGGRAVTYLPVAEVDEWVEACARLLERRDPPEARALRLEVAGKASWSRHAETILSAYQRVARGLPPGSSTS